MYSATSIEIIPAENGYIMTARGWDSSDAILFVATSLPSLMQILLDKKVELLSGPRGLGGEQRLSPAEDSGAGGSIACTAVNRRRRYEQSQQSQSANQGRDLAPPTRAIPT